MASSPVREEEISPIELGRIMLRHKGMIVAGLLICLLPASLYLLIANPVFRATVYLLPPPQTSIQGLIVTIDNLGTQKYTPEAVYTAFLEKLKSPGLRREFFTENKLVDHYLSDTPSESANLDSVFSERFNSKIHVRVDGKDPAFVSVSFSDSDSDFAARSLNQLIGLADRRTVDQLVDDVNATVKSQITAIQHQISVKRVMAETTKRDTIAKLREARSIAGALGIEDGSTFPMLAGTANTRLAINTTQLPLYMRGVKALDTEITALKSRESIDPFIDGLRELQERLALLKAVSINRDSLAAVTVDDAARPPYRPVSPRYALVILLAVVAGLMLGIVLVFIAGSVVGKKDDKLV